MSFGHWFVSVVLLAVLVASLVNGADNITTGPILYSIQGSQFIRPNAKYFVSVNLHQSDRPVAIQVSIQNNATKDSILLSQNVTLEPLSSQTIEFKTGDLDPIQSNYRLVAEGLSGLVFRNETTLWINEKNVSIHVQTDRPEYAVGDKLKFRVIILDVDTKPVTVINNLSIFLKNNTGSIVKAWLNESTYQGAFNGEITIDDSSFGKWQIAAKYLEQSQVTKFNVIQLRPYIFQITIDTKPSVVYADKVISARISVKKHGQPVKGEANIRLASLFARLYDGVELKQSKIIEPNGDVFVDFKLDQLHFNELHYRQLELFVNVTEKDTGRSSNCSAHIQVHTNSNYLRQINAITFSPGLPFTTMIQVFRHDKNPITDLSRPLTLTYSSNEEFNERSVSNVYRLDELGQFSWTIHIPKDYEKLYIKAEYEGLSEILGVLDAEESPVNAFMQLKVLNNETHIGKEVQIEVLSTEEYSWLTYLLVGRYGCFKSETIKTSNEKSFLIRLQPDARMYPDVRLIAYYFKKGEVISDVASLTFRTDFTNTINVTASSGRINAGGKLELTVETSPGSLVSLTAIDRSPNVHPAKAIDADYIAYDLSQYNEMYYDLGYRGKRVQYWLMDSKETVFTEHNTVVLSNIIPPYSREPIYDDIIEPYMSSGYEPEENWLRNSYDLANSWLFTSINVSSSSEVLRYQVPVNQKTWSISAIALHPETGFGLLQNELKIKVV